MIGWERKSNSEELYKPLFKLLYILYNPGGFGSPAVGQRPGTARLEQGGRGRGQGPARRQQGGPSHQPADDGSPQGGQVRRAGGK